MKAQLSLMATMALCLGLTGCSTLQDNEGSTLTTQDNEQLKPEYFIGKWDEDGERTNTANGNSGVVAIPADVFKDVLGKGWQFEAKGILKIDAIVGSDTGSWKLEGKDQLAMTLPGDKQRKFTASFKEGYLYLKGENGKTTVFEKSKFFGF